MSSLPQLYEDVLTHFGAAVEILDEQRLDVMLPSEVAARLKSPAYSRLTFQAHNSDEQQAGIASYAGIESDWIERLQSLIPLRVAGGGFTDRIFPAAPKAGDLSALLSKQLQLTNGVLRNVRFESCLTRYYLLVVRCVASSDDIREELLVAVVNEANGCPHGALAPKLLEALQFSGTDLEPLSDAAAPLHRHWGANEISGWLQETVPALMEQKLKLFVANLQRRMAADLQRLKDFYDGMQRELSARTATASVPSELQTSADLEQRVQAIKRECASKIDDLRHKYTLLVDVKLSSAAEFVSPVQRAHFEIHRRKHKCCMFLDYHPLSRKFDQPRCNSCCSAIAAASLSDSPVQLYCEQCFLALTPRKP